MDQAKLDLAMRAIQRTHFLPESVRQQAALDMPLGIGYGQTNSQPTTVKMMLGWLSPRPGDTVLDVGSGSGWTSALLAYLVGEEGHVYAVEKVPELVAFGRNNCESLGITNVMFHEAGEEIGLPKHAPFDRILVSAAAQEIPEALTDQLKPGGRMVIPLRDTVYEVDKNTDGSLHQTPHPGFAFVPLVG